MRRRNNRTPWRRPNDFYNNSQYNRYNNTRSQVQNRQYANQNQTYMQRQNSYNTVANKSNEKAVDDFTTNIGISGTTIQESNEKIDMGGADEQNLQGKSTGINPVQSSNNIDNQPEIQSDNVQGSTPTTNAIDATDENVQNIQSHTQTIEENEVTSESTVACDHIATTDDTPASEPIAASDSIPTSESLPGGEPTPAVESMPAIEKEPSEKNDNIENNQNEMQETFESEYTIEKENSGIDNTENDEERSHTPELKNYQEKILEKKRIILKRSPPTRRASSPLEDGEIKEPQEKSKKITLKRHISDESSSDFINKIIINRRPSGSDEKLEKRRLSTEEKTHIVVVRPTKSLKPITLNRHLSLSENQEISGPSRSEKISWGKSDWLDNVSATTYKIDVDTIKSVCPSLLFLNESEVKLESVLKERSKLDTNVKKKAEEREHTDDESGTEKSEEDSNEEQKIEANPNIIALNRKISIVDDTAAKLQPPPSPAKNPVSEILYITNLVRPFTVKQLKELLERTGKIKNNGFWTDKIKSKCYVQYETIEEAETTRNALHGVSWPIGNGKQLVIEYATEEDMEKVKNPVPLNTVPEKQTEKENREPGLVEIRRRDREREKERDLEKEERRRVPIDKERNKIREEHRRKPSKSKSRSRERTRKHSRRSYTPEVVGKKKHKKSEDAVPQKLMDDLFLKTKATPSIYWQPLSPQEIQTKQQQRLVRMEEHKRRIEETRGRLRDRDRRGTYRRR